MASRTTRRAAWLESSVVCPGWVGFQQVLSERDAHRRAYICREGVAANGTAMQVVVANQVRFGLPVLCHADSLLGCEQTVKFSGIQARRTQRLSHCFLLRFVALVGNELLRDEITLCTHASAVWPAPLFHVDSVRRPRWHSIPGEIKLHHYRPTSDRNHECRPFTNPGTKGWGAELRCDLPHHTAAHSVVAIRQTAGGGGAVEVAIRIENGTERVCAVSAPGEVEQ